MDNFVRDYENNYEDDLMRKKDDYYYDYMKAYCKHMAKMSEAHAYQYQCMKYMRKMMQDKEEND